ncbi:MAG: nitroreductase family protein [Corynebacterium sp.]|uniref:nitroreductase family protein n=1 Tax=unclassified Corynebacterium TaxID=2624378 RepID=UPI0009627B2C|nr:nitroreductase family protein [Corynebacterium sp. CNJ-954]OLT54392.1 NADPH-dependent oxidoreductase [Corynebacterium sp. CNJ-954]
MTEHPTPDHRLTERYGQPQPWSPTEWNDTLETITAHRSVRLWQDREVDDTVLSTILAAAQSAPSSSNKQTVSVVVVRDHAVKEQLAGIGKRMSSHVATAPVLLLWLVDFSQIRFHATQAEQAAETGTPGDATEIHGVSSLPPHDLGSLDYLDEPVTSVLDIGIASQTAAVAAESLGLGTVYLGSMRNDIGAVQEILGIPQDVVPFLGLAVGYGDPEENAGVKPRLPMELVVHHDRYNARSDEAGAQERTRLLADYDEALADYFARYGQHPRWSDQTLHRVSQKAATKTKRHLIRQFLEKAGFGLK